MKYFLGIISVIVIVVIFALSPIKIVGETANYQYLRIHIRANSNSIDDQNVKYKVKDAVVDALIPLLSDVQSFDDAVITIEQNLDYIENVANEVLLNENFDYISSAKIGKEYFPTRVYENLTLEEGVYDAVVLNLGSGTGDNWWCLVYPAFCFTNSTNSDNVVYISKIWEIIKSVI
jgi:stage II sporulation protein R